MKCETCGCNLKRGEAIKVKKKNYCSMECAGLYVWIYKPKKEGE